MLKGIALVLMLALLGVAAQPAADSSTREPVAQRATGGTLTFAPAAPVAGATGRFRVKVPTSGRRVVQLQRLAAGTWKRVASKSTTTAGVATFDITVPARRTTYRAFAPRVSTKRLAPVTTAALAVMPSLRGTMSDLGEGEFPKVSADGAEVVWQGFSEEGFYTADLHPVGGGTRTVASPAGPPVVSGDGGSVLFTKGGQGIWDSTWGLRLSDGTDEGDLLWEERASEEDSPREFDAGGIAADGEYASVVVSDPELDDLGVYLVTRSGGRSRIADATSVDSDIAPDSSCVSFDSTRRLVPADTNGVVDAYVWIRATDELELVSRLPDGSPSPRPSRGASMSEGCRYVTYSLEKRFPVQEVWLWDRQTDTRQLLSVGPRGVAESASYDPTVSADGSQVVFTSTGSLTLERDDGGYDVYLWSRASNSLTLLTPSGTVGAGFHPDISDDGRHVVFDMVEPGCESPCDYHVYRWSRTG
jgi:hypothetical protein